MLTKCKECGLDVSDKAVSCPHCGFPVGDSTAAIRRPRKPKRKRLPNGFGQISEIKGKALRKPFRATVSVGKSENGRPICKLLEPVAYFETYNEAYAALLEHHKNPYDKSKDITMLELFKRWFSEHSKTLKAKESARTIESMWKHCSPIYEMKVKDMRAANIKEFVLSLQTTDGNKKVIRQILNMMFDYAVEYEIVDRNHARTVNLKGQLELGSPEDAHMTYSNDEMKLLWSNINKSRVLDMVLFQCYTGFRPQELCLIELQNVDLDNGTIIGGMKTDAGKDRMVPIHSKISQLVRRWYEKSRNSGCKYLFSDITYNNFRYLYRYEVVRIGLSEKHRPHDGRVRFVSAAKECGMNEYAIKLIVGHAISDLTERVYTKRNVEWLKCEIEKLV